jgi:hypothetical protein
MLWSQGCICFPRKTGFNPKPTPLPLPSQVNMHELSRPLILTMKATKRSLEDGKGGVTLMFFHSWAMPLLYLHTPDLCTHRPQHQESLTHRRQEAQLSIPSIFHIIHPLLSTPIKHSISEHSLRSCPGKVQEALQLK